jgi:hypothetical protein
MNEADYQSALGSVFMRIDRVETRVDTVVNEGLHSLDGRIRALEADYKIMSERMAEFRADLKENTTWTKTIMETLTGHVQQENRDRIILLLGVLGTILTVIVTAIVNHVVA